MESSYFWTLASIDAIFFHFFFWTLLTNEPRVDTAKYSHADVWELYWPIGVLPDMAGVLP